MGLKAKELQDMLFAAMNHKRNAERTRHRGGEMMAKGLIKIRSCDECDHFSPGDSENPDYCLETGTAFVDPWVTGYPDWCPLEDAPDTGEEE